MEKVQFRELLLFLRDSMEDDDIPRRSKVRSLIMKALEDHFGEVTKELQVWYFFPINELTLIEMTAIIGKSQLYC